tara:strand:- start:5222 stop:6310 length:1089 start_codon:yes stop_codon:yes gene_type:complete
MSFLIVFISFLLLIVLHELGHFLFAKKFGVKVEEFGIGLPPRLIGKKIGETIYSFNLLPLGAFVRLQGEEEATSGPRSFNQKPLWQRATIIVAGVVAFWIVAALIFIGLAATTGIPSGISDETTQGIVNSQVRIIAVAPDSPAKEAGVALGDTIMRIQDPISASQIEPTTITQVQEFTRDYLGQELLLTLQRGAEISEVNVVARIDPPSEQGPLGVALVRTGMVKYVWYEAPFQGIAHTWKVTHGIVRGLGGFVVQLVQGKGIPEGVEVMGPVGILHLLSNSFSLGIAQFLSFFAILSVYLAIFNALPIPVVDGGKLLFLGIEAIRKKPFPELWEKRISAAFFALLITLMIWITIKDVIRIF